MRPLSLCALALLLAPATAQVRPASDYVRAGGSWYRLVGSERFRVHPEVVTVRLAPPLSTWTELVAAASAQPGPARAAIARLEHLRTSRSGFHDLRIVDGSDVFAVLGDLRASPLVIHAEENALGRWTAVPDDPSFASQWALDNQGQTGGTVDADIDAVEAWDLSTGDSSVVVGVIDSGVDVTHPDLAPSLWTNLLEVPGNGIDDDGNGFTDDVFGWDFLNGNGDLSGPNPHGTLVTGILGARANDGFGVAGVCGGFGAQPGCRVVCVSIGDLAPDSSLVDDAIDYAVTAGASVINLSFTVPSSAAIDAAIQQAHDVDGVVFVGAAGNDGGLVDYPASLSRVIAVASTNQDDVRVGGSNTGPDLWFSAPGQAILTTNSGGGHAGASGTSFAAPHVAGVAALVRSLRPGYDTASVAELLKDGADDVGDPGFDLLTGWGRVNARRTLELALERDCNLNGVYDGLEIAAGEPDLDGDGVLDACEQGYALCFGDGSGASCPCGNLGGPGEGCAHSEGIGMEIVPFGSTSIAADDFVAFCQQVPMTNTGIFYAGTVPVANHLYDGIQCTGGDVRRFQGRFQFNGFVQDSGFVAQDPSGVFFQPGGTYYFQYWTRDVANGPTPCGTWANFSPALKVVMQP